MATPRKPTPPTTTAIDAFCAQFDDLFCRRAELCWLPSPSDVFQRRPRACHALLAFILESDHDTADVTVSCIAARLACLDPNE